ncbi:alpha/beta fold hydrolase [Pedobacter sp. Leaf194]|uniref:alpha/beta hydrolase family protein n=1 Tax=Pedobacter sp. Leaf194 TaxID=1736297 RepID=UPI0009E803F8|nr:alpha/beta fold hydrolase [Pedobacter sp. Leaf194]
MKLQNPIISISPILLKVPNRLAVLEIKVTAPASGGDLPVILLSHGHGASNFLSSYRGYAPLVDYYASQGFVVIQPTHQDSKTLALETNGPEGALFWKSRAEDLIFIIDNLRQILSGIKDLNERTDINNIAAVGHSMGGHTVAMLAGMQVYDPVSCKFVGIAEPRINAFVMFGTPGNGEDIAEWASERYPILKGTEFSKMQREVLVVAGDHDSSNLFSTRDDWRMDAYHASPGPKTLLTVFGSGHMLGGISGYDALETAQTNDENPGTVKFVGEITSDYIRTRFYPENKSWENTTNALLKNEDPKGKIDSKPSFAV